MRQLGTTLRVVPNREQFDPWSPPSFSSLRIRSKPSPLLSDSTDASTRFILLGASNLTIGFPLLVENLHRAANGDCEIFAAGGFGRSYGASSRFLLRELPGIAQCSLWDTLDRPVDSGRTFALLTDVGNDLLYGFSPKQIAGWVCHCLERLKAMGARIILTLPPVDAVRGLSRWRYSLFRTCFFPFSRISYLDAQRSAEELHVAIAELGTAHADIVAELPGDWYGFDPIHIRRRERPQAWRTILAGWQGIELPEQMIKPGSQLRRQIGRAREHTRRVRGVDQRCEQPAIIRDGLRVSLF